MHDKIIPIILHGSDTTTHLLGYSLFSRSRGRAQPAVVGRLLLVPATVVLRLHQTDGKEQHVGQLQVTDFLSTNSLQEVHIDTLSKVQSKGGRTRAETLKNQFIKVPCAHTLGNGKQQKRDETVFKNTCADAMCMCPTHLCDNCFWRAVSVFASS
jgi:hypothetical protein